MKIIENQMAGNAPAKTSRPAYMPDDRPLTARQVAAVRKLAASRRPKGAVQGKQSLF